MILYDFTPTDHRKMACRGFLMFPDHFQEENKNEIQMGH